MAGRCRGADRESRGALLGEMEQVTGLNRKSLIRLLGQKSLDRQNRQAKRGRSYGPEVAGLGNIIT